MYCLQTGSGENPKAAAVREQLRKRLSEQEEKERATKTELVQKAANYLEQFYEVHIVLSPLCIPNLAACLRVLSIVVSISFQQDAA